MVKLNRAASVPCQDTGHDRLLWACIAGATGLHVLVLAVHFTAAKPPASAMRDIALAVRLSPQPVAHADYLSQASQQGSGTLKNAHKLTSPTQQAVAHDQQQIAAQFDVQTRQQQRTSLPAEQVLVSRLSWQNQPRNPEQLPELVQQWHSSPDLAQAELIASLEAQYARRKQEYSRKTRVHTVDGISAQADPSAAYVHQFIQKVEQAGNRHYPLEARARQLQGEVQLMVILAPSGRIRAIRLLQGSGYALLDEAAKESVRQAAPFGAFDQRMKQYHELRIIRTWRFSKKREDLDVSS